MEVSSEPDSDAQICTHILIQIRLQRAAVGLIIAMRAEYASMRRTPDAPSKTIAVDDRTIHSQETSQVIGHTKPGVSSRDELRDGSFPIVREVATIRG